MNSTKLFLPLLIVCSIQAASAQSYSVDYTFDRSHNSRIEQNGKYGLIDTNKRILIPAVYEAVTDFHDGFARVIKNGKVGFVNTKAEEVIPCVYEQDEQIITGAVIYYVREAMNEITTIQVGSDERRQGFNEGFFCMIKNGKYGFINKKNEIIIPFQYDGADNFYDSIAIIKQQDKYGAIDRTGKIVIPLDYDLLVWDMSTNSPDIYARKNGRIFHMNKDRKEIK